MDLIIAFQIGYAFRLGYEFARKPNLVSDDAKWITIHPNGRRNKGRRALIDSASGQIIGGSIPQSVRGTNIKDLKNKLDKKENASSGSNVTYTLIKIEKGRPPSMSEADQDEIHNVQNVEQLNLTAEQRNYVELYSEDGYRTLNKSLREETSIVDPQMLKCLDEIIDRMPAKKDMTVFRYCGEQALLELDKNGFMVDKGYLSTTTSDGCLQDFFKNDKKVSSAKYLIINVPKGTSAASIREISSNDSENEVLLKRNTRLTLKGKHKVKCNGVEIEYYYVDAT